MRSVFFISDQTGITTEGMGNALLTQFNEFEFRKELIPFVNTQLKADKALAKIQSRFIQDGKNPIVLSSIIDKEIRNRFKANFIKYIDFFELLIPQLEEEIGQKASPVTGKLHSINNEGSYYKRIDAIDFAMLNDDGVSVCNYEDADVILLGVSRVGKTPTCVYLAVNYGIKAANYPFAENDFLQYDKIPKILTPYHNRLFGLTTDPERLQQIRFNRLPNTKYSSIATCRNEVMIAERMMSSHGIPFLNTSKKSIEEIASAIMQSTCLVRKF